MIPPPGAHWFPTRLAKYATVILVLLIGTNLGVHAQERPKIFCVAGVAAGDSLNVRSGPGERFSIIARLQNGTTGIRIDGQIVWNGSDDWIPINVSGSRGWVRPKFLSLSDDEIASNADVPVRRATSLEADENTSDTNAAPKDHTATSVSSDNDPFLLCLFALLAGAIIVDEFSGGDSVSQEDQRARDAAESANIYYTRQKFERIENDLARSRGDRLPYPNTPQ